MILRLKTSITLGLLLSLGISCQRTKESKEHHYSNMTNSITITGSDTEYQMVKALAEEYMLLNPYITIKVEGGGSNKGVHAFLNHETDICNSSHIMKEKEHQLAEANNINPNAIIFSVDAVAMITNYRLCIDSLSTKQIADIFSGRITRWKELGGPDVPINIYGRNKSSGTYDYINEKFMKGKKSSNIIELNTNEDIVERVKQDIGGIGYVGAGFLMDEKGKPNGQIWAMQIYLENHRAFSPYETEAVKNGDYVLTRPLYQYVNGVPESTIQDFILFELTRKGQEIVQRFGFYPINDNQAQINKLKGI